MLMFCIRRLCNIYDLLLGQGKYTHIYRNSCDRFREYLKMGRPVLTFANHTSTIDEPYILHHISPQTLSKQHSRWIWCASDICYKHWYYPTWFFKTLKVHPIVRGDGIYQQGMQWARYKLLNNEWFHIFPEGKCYQHIGYNIKSFRWGIGKLIVDIQHLNPLVVPIAHHGMDIMLPFNTYIPKNRTKIGILVGDPIDFSDLLSFEKPQYHDDEYMKPSSSLSSSLSSNIYPNPKDPIDLYEHVTTRTEDTLRHLMQQLEQLNNNNI